ncbi:unnamed protein product [Closterium sp. NIES-53]
MDPIQAPPSQLSQQDQYLPANPPSQPPSEPLPPSHPPPWPAYEPAAIHKLPRDVIAKIFSHLSIADRCSVSLVCSLWFRYERLLPHYMQSEVGSTELRFVLRRFPLIRTLHIHLFGPTVLPGAPREERAADDRHHKRTGWGGGGGVEAGGWGGGTGIKGGGAQVGGSGTESGGGETWNVSPHAAASTPPSSSAAASAAAAAAAVASPISGQQILDLTAIVRILSLNTPLQIQQMAGTQVESEVQQGLLNYMRHVVATWGRNIRHIEMHDPLPSSDEFWRCVDGGGFAELAEKCPGLEEIVLEDLTLSVVAKKARSAPGGGSAAGEGVGEEPGEVERAHGAMGANEADGWGGAVRESGEAEAAEVQAGAEGGKGAAAEGRGGNLAASFPNLSSLKVVNCALDAHWLEMFAGQLPGLRRLTIMACPDPLDQLFFTAVRTAARLESVEIVDCEGVSDNCIVALLKICPTINSLTLSGCEGGSGGPGEGGGEGGGMGGGGGDVNGGTARVTDESLGAVVVYGVSLRSLQLKWSPGFTGLQLA